VWANVGGATGGAVLGLVSQRVRVKHLTIAVLVISTAMVMLFGHSPPDLKQLSVLCAVAGFFTNAGVVGIYAILAQAFPTHVRAFGTGFAIGVGRGGSALAPIVAGFLFKAGYSLPNVAMWMACGSLLAAGALLMLKLRPDQPIVEGTLDRDAAKGSPAAS
jgi:MFS family permease